MEPTISAYIQVRRSGIHNRGVFAAQDIPKGTHVIEYVGEKITKKESERRYASTLDSHRKDRSNGAVYIFDLDKRYDLDGNVHYNTARLINHSCDPNCEAVNEDGHIWIIALRDIKRGEEISYDYGYSLDDFEDHPCMCGSPKCVGYIVSRQYWPQLRRSLKKRGSLLQEQDFAT